MLEQKELFPLPSPGDEYIDEHGKKWIVIRADKKTRTLLLRCPETSMHLLIAGRDFPWTR